jgi:hypothetical protein
LVRGYAGQLTVIGDSVVLGARSAVERGIDGASVYATVGWQAADVLKMLERIRGAGDLQPARLRSCRQDQTVVSLARAVRQGDGPRRPVDGDDPNARAQIDAVLAVVVGGA